MKHSDFYEILSRLVLMIAMAVFWWLYFGEGTQQAMYFSSGWALGLFLASTDSLRRQALNKEQTQRN